MENAIMLTCLCGLAALHALHDVSLCGGAMLRIFSSARDTMLAFVLASVGTLVGTAVAWLLLSQQLGPGGWQVKHQSQI